MCTLIVVERVPDFSSSLSSNSFMVLERYISVTIGLELAILFTAWILSAMASLAGAWARRIAVLLGTVSSMLPRCGMKSTRLPSMDVDLCNHSV